MSRCGRCSRGGRGRPSGCLGVLCASLCLGYCYADAPSAGMHAVVTADRRDVALLAARRLALATWERREDFRRELVSVDAAIARAARAPAMVALCDTGDNVGGGADGSQSALPRALVHPASTPRRAIRDPRGVLAARGAGVGGSVSLVLGDPPWELSARVVRLCDGRFVNRGPLSAGVAFDMGPTAVSTPGGCGSSCRPGGDGERPEPVRLVRDRSSARCGRWR